MTGLGANTSQSGPVFACLMPEVRRSCMKSSKFRKSLLALVTVVSTACVDAPAQEAFAPTDNNPLASSFDLLAQEQMVANDVERSEELRWAALSLRAGVTPSVLEVTHEGRTELFDAFVHSATWASLTQSLRPPSYRSMVAWRRTGDMMQVLLLGTYTDSAPVLHPYSLRNGSPGVPTTSPIPGATAAYFERGSRNSTWLGVGGSVYVAEHPQPNSCPTTNSSDQLAGVNCQLTRFGVSLNVTFARTRSRDSREVDVTAPTQQILAAGQTIAGAKLVFSCASPSGTGC
jgi:hypothetical protein